MKYFAYGSNMKNSQMIRRCPNFKILGKAKLNGFPSAVPLLWPHQ